MKTKLVLTLFILFALFLTGSSRGAARGEAAAAALGTAITYQGRLTDGGVSASGTYDFQFTLYNAEVGGAQVGSLVTRGDVPVSDGYFTVQLDFGAGAFGSEARWLELAVRPGASTGAYTVLSPRQALTPAPSAQYASNAGYAFSTGSAPWSGLTGVPAGFADGVDNDTLYSAGTGLGLSSGQFSLGGTYRLPQSCSTNQLPKWNGSAWICAADETGAAGSFWNLTGNAGTNPASNYLGTSDNQAFEIRVNGQRALRLEPGNYSTINVIGGYSGNTVTSGVYSATISGGGASGTINRVTDGDGTIGGGIHNIAGNNNADLNDAVSATVSGGSGNIAGGLASTVGGGESNTASGYGSAIGGGMNNIATGWMSRVGGGWNNETNSNGATVGGGTYNFARAAYATISGGGPSDPNNAFPTGNRVFDNYGTIGGGGYNRVGSDDGNTTTAPSSTVSGGGLNTASGIAATVGGGTANQATFDFATVGGGSLNTASGNVATVGGGNVNTASGNSATVGGGANNKASGGSATVGGGSTNTASGNLATVGGGIDNTAIGNNATVGGGNINKASGNSATVGGGTNNIASGLYSDVGGGVDNLASGVEASIPGGRKNVASGTISFAAGNEAIASREGAFVWADATNHSYDPFSYLTPGGYVNSFNVRATGGVYLVTAVNASTGVPTAGMYLSGGGSGWNVYSDRSFKTNFQPVNSRDLLERLAAIPVSSWNYKTQNASVRHIGPMAQDFNGAFGVGEADKSGEKRYINSVDADGVALTAIQGLYQLNQQQAAEIQSLKARLSKMETSGSPHTTSSLPLVWVGLGLLGIAQVGMFLALRRKLGGRS